MKKHILIINRYEHKKIPTTDKDGKTVKKLWKENKKCKRCGRMFERKHQSRLYCDECKRIIEKKR